MTPIQAPDGKILIDSYIKWLKAGFEFKQKDEYCEITTPLLDRHNDHLQIYVKGTEKGMMLTDDSYIIGDLLASGLDINNKKREAILNSILKRYGVYREEDSLVVKATSIDFPQKKHNLLQAMIAINDLFYTSRLSSENIFSEEVATYLNENNIPYTQDVHLIGRSGLTHSYDFLIPKSKTKPSKAIKVVNNLTVDKAKVVLFSCSDTQEIRTDIQIYPFINDLERSIQEDLIIAFKEYKLRPVLWSERQKYVEELAA